MMNTGVISRISVDRYPEIFSCFILYSTCFISNKSLMAYLINPKASTVNTCCLFGQKMHPKASARESTNNTRRLSVKNNKMKNSIKMRYSG
jgi:hypothetical protein